MKDFDIDAIPGWFGMANRSNLQRLIQEYSISEVIEIGSFLGQSTIWFAQRVPVVYAIDRWFEYSLVAEPNNLVSMIDRWRLPHDFFPVFQQNVFKAGLWDRIVPIRGDSRDVSAQVPPADPEKRLVYIDGSHTYQGCRSDIVLYGPMGKVISGDDYAAGRGFNVIEAVTDCLPQHHHEDAFWWHVRGVDGVSIIDSPWTE